MNELALFAGAGGGLLASKWLLGWRTVCYVENAEYPAKILQARIKDGLLDDAPIWDDVRTFDGKPWRGCVDIVSAGFPCQPFAAGGLGRGEDDARNMWPDTVRVISEVGPTWVLLENSPKLLQFSKQWQRRAYVERIVAELAEIGYVGRWGCLSAASVGMQHKRERVWIVAYAFDEEREVILCGDAGNGDEGDGREAVEAVALDAVWSRLSLLEERLGEPSVFGDDDGLAYRVDRLAAVGEGQVPGVVARVWGMLVEDARDGESSL